MTFQPGDKESLTSVDVVRLGEKAIPSSLIVTAKVLLEEYVMVSIDKSVILTYTTSRFNTAHKPSNGYSILITTPLLKVRTS